MSFESSNTNSPTVDHELAQRHIDSPDASPKRSMSLESSNTKSSLDRASIPAVVPLPELLNDNYDEYDHGYGQNHTRSFYASGKRWIYLESSNELYNASIFAQPETPPPRHIFEGHANKIRSFVFLHDDKHIVSSSEDGTMRKWDCETGLLVGEPWKGEGGKIYALALSPDGKTIACGRDDGIVQRWNTDGEMNKDVWKDDHSSVLSLSWSPNGDHIASGSHDGTIMIRKAENGEVEVGPMRGLRRVVNSLAYSPSGDRIASIASCIASNQIEIWDSNTGDLILSSFYDLGLFAASVLWSSDSSKLYCASHSFAHVFDSVSGKELHRFEDHYYACSVALSPKHNLLACVGTAAQLWDTESYQPYGEPFSTEDREALHCVSFSRDGRYLACGGDDKKITLWMVKDVGPIRPALPSSSCLEVDVTNPSARSGGGDIEDGHDNPYSNFFQPLDPSHPSEAYGPPRPSQPYNFLSLRRLWNVFTPSRHGRLADQSIPLQPRIKRGLFSRSTGLQPVTVSAARPRRFYWTVPQAWRPVVPENEGVEEENGNANAHAGQSSIAVQSPHAAAPFSTPQGPQNIQAQPATRTPREDEPDYGCWGNFLHAVCCIPHAHAIVPAVQPATS